MSQIKTSRASKNTSTAMKQPIPRSSGPLKTTTTAADRASINSKTISTSRMPIKPAMVPGRPSPRSSTIGQPTRTPSARKMPAKAPATATSTQPRAGNWISQAVQNSVAGVGNYAGGFVNSIGESVNKVGQGIGDSITNTTRNLGQGVAGYGNDIKDSVGVGGPRVATGANPLGLAGQGAAKKNPPVSQKKIAPGNHLGL